MKNKVCCPRFLAFGAFILIFPFFLRQRNRVVCRAILRGKPADIFPLVNDLRNWPRWTAWNRREEIHYAYEGPPSGVGSVQKWSSRRTAGELRVIQSTPDERVAYTISMSGSKYAPDGMIALEPVSSEHTRVTWIAKWNGSPNPYARYFDLLLRWWIGRDFAASLENLRELAETRRASTEASA